MASSKKELMQYDKRFLLEKIHQIEEREQWLMSRIKAISAVTITDAKKLLTEADRKKFAKRYKQVNPALETSLSTLITLTASFPSSDCDNDSDSSSSTSSGPESTSTLNDNISVSIASVSSCSSGTKTQHLMSSDSPRKWSGDGGDTGGSANVTHGGTVQHSGSGTVPKHSMGPPGDASLGSLDVGMQGRDSKSLLHASRPPSGTMGSSRVPPGLKPPEGTLEKAIRVPAEPTKNRDFHPEGKSSTLEKKVLSQGPQQLDGCGNAQLQNQRQTPPADPSTASTSQPAVQHQYLPNSAQPQQPPGTNNPTPYPAQSQPCPTSQLRVVKEKQKAVIRPLEPKIDGQVDVVVSEVRNPNIFWVQLADSPLGTFSQQLNQFYSIHQNIPIPAPVVGVFCCACFTQDNSWYRARVIDVQGQIPGKPPNLDDPIGITVGVIYVDYGNQERLNLTRLRVIHPDFTRLPAQTFCCLLAKVKPPDPGRSWAKDHIKLFETLVFGKIIRCTLTTPCKDSRMHSLDMLVPVMPDRTPSGDQHVDVAKEMVQRGMAQYIAGCEPQEGDTKPSEASGDPTLPRNTTQTKGGRAEDPSPQVGSKTVSAASDCGPDTKKPEQRTEGNSSKACSTPATNLSQVQTRCIDQSRSVDRNASSAPKKPAKQAQPTQMDKQTGRKAADPKGAKPKSDSNHDVKRSSGSTLMVYDELEDQEVNAFPKAKHIFDPAWRKLHTELRGDEERLPPQSSDSVKTYTNKGSSKEPPLHQDATIKTANRNSVSLPSQRSPPHSGQTGSPKQKGSWAGRGSRLKGSMQAPQPHNLKKNVQQMHQGSKTTASVMKGEDADCHSTGKAYGAISNQKDAAKSEEHGLYQDAKVDDEQAVNQKRKERPVKDPDSSSSSHGEAKNTPEANGYGRFSPNSSSGVSSCNSVQSSVKKITDQTEKSKEEDVQEECSIKEQCQEKLVRDAAESDLKCIISKMSSSEMNSEHLDSEKADEDQEMEQTEEVSTGGLNKPLSVSSKNLSSSCSSFYSAFTEIDSKGSKKTPIPSASENSSSSEVVDARRRPNPKSPPCQDLQLSKRDSLFIENSCFPLAMSHIVSPQEFYIHLVTPDATKLDYLADDLNAFYNSEKAENMSEELRLEPGVLCAAKYTLDGDWYRAKIISIRDVEVATSSEGPDSRVPGKQVRVMFVDYGNQEWQKADALKPLQALFYELPGQVIKCSLAHINPLESKEDWESQATKTEGNRPGEWCEDTIKEFTKMTGFEKKLRGRPTRDYDPDSEDPLPLVLLDPSSSWEICINQELVNRGLAASTRFVPEKPQKEGKLSNEITDRQLLMATERWHLKKYMEGGYDPVPEESQVGPPPPCSGWDPMQSDFESTRNSYSIDTDDPGVATVGYKAESTRQLCRFFSTGKLCYRGKQCPYEHAKPGERPLESVDVFSSNDRVLLPPAGSVVALEITALFNAFHFWAQLPYFARPLDRLQERRPLIGEDDDEETLELLEESLNRTYSVSKHRRVTSLTLRARGEMVCCRCPQDQRYYRARVSEVATDAIQVCYVDYGNSEWVPESDVHDLQQQFMHLPVQAVECRLVGARPLDDNVEAGSRPDDEARRFFEEMACNKTLVAHVVTVLCNGEIAVELYDTNGKSEINIAEALIENRLATAVGRGSRPHSSISSEDRGSFAKPGADGQSTTSEASSGRVALVPG